MPANQRGFAQGIEVFIEKTLGFLPGAILFGSLFDFSCLVWGEKCGERGKCQMYDVDKFFDWLGGICVGFGG